MKQDINCPCSRKFTVEYDQEIDLDQNPEHIDRICNGTFMSYTCPGCEKIHKPEYKIMLVWKSKNYKLEVLPELDRGGFYRNKKEKLPHETIIGYPEMADRITVIKDDINPLAIETLKYYLLAKAEENYPDSDINAWYYGKNDEGIEFHLDGIRQDEVAVMRIPKEVYEKTCEDIRRRPKNDVYTSLRCRSYLSVQNILRPDALK